MSPEARLVGGAGRLRNSAGLSERSGQGSQDLGIGAIGQDRGAFGETNGFVPMAKRRIGLVREVPRYFIKLPPELRL